MPYIVQCDDGNGPIGPFRDEDAAHRYAALCDVDPACRDDHHDVEWSDMVKAPEDYETLRRAVMRRIQDVARRSEHLCANCGCSLGANGATNAKGELCCSDYCAADEWNEGTPLDLKPFERDPRLA